MDEYFQGLTPYSLVLAPNYANIGGLYLGTIEIAENEKELQKLKIGAVVSIIGYPLKLGIGNYKFKHLYLEAFDKEDQPISQYFDTSNKFIEENIKKTNIYIHCQMGISRSSSLVLAYLLYQKKISTLENELKFLKTKRPFACPNDNFMKQLKSFEKLLHLAKK